MRFNVFKHVNTKVYNHTYTDDCHWQSSVYVNVYMLMCNYAVVGVSTGTFGRGVVMGMSGGVGSVGGAEFGIGTSSGGVVVADWWKVCDITNATLVITV